MQWDLTGLVIDAVYLDVPVIGRVVNSRVAYGGDVHHTLVLLTPIQLPFKSTPTDRCIVDHKSVTRVRSSV